MLAATLQNRNPQANVLRPLLITRRRALAGGFAAILFPFSSSFAADGGEKPVSSGDSANAPEPLTFDRLSQKMAEKAQQPYAEPESALPEIVRDLTYDAHRAIAFRPDHALWRAEPVDFHLQAFYPGWVFDDTATVSIGRDGQYEPHIFQADDFEYRPPLNPAEFDDISFPGVAGFRIHAPLERPDYFDELVTFLGASYFRALGMGTRYGLSARGLAINTATDETEEFPRFTAFYIDAPKPGESSIRLMAELESPSVAGAYEFVIEPGPETVMTCRQRLYFRETVSRLGIAPLTSMFTFGENDGPDHDDFRPEVHDSDGLFIERANGEQFWRPLQNPQQLALSFIGETNPKSFGLLQRDRSFESYQDTESRYELRPSLLIEPIGEWGAGTVELVEIPTATETNDNIVAFWIPEQRAEAGSSMEFSYRMRWGLDVEPAQDRARVSSTLTGIGGNAADTDEEQTTRRMVVNFTGGPAADLPDDAEIEPEIEVTSAGRLLNSAVARLPGGGWRVSLELERIEERPVEMRVKLTMLRRSISETWMYQWTTEA
ncbi:periplasmic glucan biosynthesis protein [Fulvimarina pelagi HTCC2506]|uniref:Glucans biosynthesis protein G n=1 Tax=Fulvimarina pelagi HTCC2506 TaxID=314231 RepID=Q0G5B7_9HYPH|nr:periplasmic glucan biosynthesis protein [Fulvimarina pelagi HTCC2506]